MCPYPKNAQQTNIDESKKLHGYGLIYMHMDRGGEYQIGYLQNLQVISLWYRAYIYLCNNNA